MIVKAYRTNCCNTLKEEDEVHGLINTPDMFDNENSFKTVAPEKSEIHYCTDCYIKRVVEPTDSIFRFRKHTKTEYRDKIQEYTYVFRKSLFVKQKNT